MKKLIFSALCLIFLGCVSQQKYTISPQFSAFRSEKLVLLPFENRTVDLSAQEILRKMVHRRFTEKGYSLLSIEETDEKLRSIGITDGGQLNSAQTDKLEKLFGKGMFCYGIVEDFMLQNVGFVVRKKVALSLKISSSSGEILFEASGEGRDLKIFTDREKAKKAFVTQTAVKLVQNILKTPLLRESEIAVEKIFSKIP
ncbi:MAG: DUF799 family lipoprotein [Elusimicrobia bacterium]|nr:DUF799 family lipoprotein [Elusimicrobiota bacterium]